MTGSFLGLLPGQYMVSDVWTGQSLGYYDHNQFFTISVPPMGVRFLKYSVVKISQIYQDIEEINFCKIRKPGTSGWLYYDEV